MIRRLEHDHVPFAGVGAGEAQRQLVRLARRIHEVDDTIMQLARKRRRQPLGVLVHEVARVARVRVQHRHLRLTGADNPRMTMADVRHVVVRVDVLPSDVVVEILHPATLDFDRRPIRDAQISAECLPASGDGR